MHNWFYFMILIIRCILFFLNNLTTYHILCSVSFSSFNFIFIYYCILIIYVYSFSNNHLNNQHFKASLEKHKQLHVSNTQQLPFRDVLKRGLLIDASLGIDALTLLSQSGLVFLLQGKYIYIYIHTYTHTLVCLCSYLLCSFISYICIINTCIESYISCTYV